MFDKVKAYLFLFLFIVFSLYSLFWIVSVYEVRHFIKNLTFELNLLGIRANIRNKIEFSGFPLSFSFKIKGLDLSLNRNASNNDSSFHFSEIHVRSNIFLNKLSISNAGSIVKKSTIIDENRQMHTFLVRYKISPKINILLDKSMVYLLLKNNTLQDTLSYLAKMHYSDNGMRCTDDSGTVIFDNKGDNDILIECFDFFIKDKNNFEKKSRELILKIAINNNSEELSIIDDGEPRSLNTVFKIIANLRLLVPSNFFRVSDKRIKIDCNQLLYNSNDFSLSFTGNGLLTNFRLLGNFNLNLDGYENFFDQFLMPIVKKEEHFEEIMNLLKINSKLDDKVMTIEYSAGPEGVAYLGDETINNLASFIYPRLSNEFLDTHNRTLSQNLQAMNIRPR